MSTTIVVPLSGPRIGGSRLSERAVPYAKSLARRTNSSVVLVSVVDMPLELSAYYSLPVADQAMEHGPIAERKRYLQDLALEFDDLPIETVVRFGDPSDEVVAEVEQRENPIIVLASHAYAGAERAILGSVAFSIIHGVRCPILIVPTPSNEFDMSTLPERGTILVPLDGSFLAESALSQPLQLLGKPDFSLHLLYVVVPATDFDGVPIEAFVGPKEEWATHYLQSVADQLTARGYLVTWSVKIGDVPEEILTVSDEIDADLIGMATHGRHGVGRMLFGSVAERLAHEVNVPLLLIHPEPKLLTAENGEEIQMANGRSEKTGARVVNTVPF